MQLLNTGFDPTHKVFYRGYHSRRLLAGGALQSMCKSHDNGDVMPCDGAQESAGGLMERTRRRGDSQSIRKVRPAQLNLKISATNRTLIERRTD